MLEYWSERNEVCTITTDNASDMCAGIKLLHEKLHCGERIYRVLGALDVRYMACRINLGEKECLRFARNEIITIS